MLHVLPDLLREHMSAEQARFLTALTRAVIRGIFVQAFGNVYECHRGIPTGLPPCCSLANIYLVGLDRHVLLEAKANVSFYRRYIDDILTGGNMDDQDFRDLLSRWPGALGFSTNVEDVTVFLDLELQLINQRPAWALHTKPLNRFLYLAGASSHPPSVFRGVYAGGAQRIRKRFSSGQGERIRRELELFRCRLQDRGYQASDLIERPSRKSRLRPAASIKVRFHPAVNVRVIKKALKPLQAGIRWSLNANRFLQSYSRTWRSGW